MPEPSTQSARDLAAKNQYWQLRVLGEIQRLRHNPFCTDEMQIKLRSSTARAIEGGDMGPVSQLSRQSLIKWFTEPRS
jgi:hypothetical protein